MRDFKSMLILALLIWIPRQGFADGIKEAYRNFGAEKYDEAAKQFKEYSKSHPQEFDQLYNTGVALYQQGQLAEAQEYFDKARQSDDPKLKAKAAYNKGMALIGQKKLKEAESSLQEALSYDNDNKAIQENLAWVTQEKKKPQDPSKPDQKQNSKPQDAKDDEQKQAQQGQQDSKQSPSETTEKSEKSAQSGPDEKSSQADKDGKDSLAKEQKKQREKSAEADKNGKDAQAKQEQDKKFAEDSNGKNEQQGDQAETVTPTGAETEKNPNGSSDGLKRSLTVRDLKKQEAEKLLRSVDDRLGRYTLIPGQADVEGKSKNGKEW